MDTGASTPSSKTPDASATNKAGVIGLTLSIAGFCLCGFWLLTIPGLIVSLIGLRKEPRAAAIGGSIVGAVGVLEFIVMGPLLIAIMLPALGRARIEAGNNVTSAKIKMIHNASEKYQNDRGSYPESINELEIESYINSDGSIKNPTLDSWDQELKFEGGGKTSPVITSAGSDGEFGTDDDITNTKD